MNDILSAMRKGHVVFGMGVTMLRGIAAGRLAKGVGFDWLFIDMEHGAFTIGEASEISLGALSCGVAPIVRCRLNALDEAARVLDNGAQGIVLPQVNSAADVQRAVAALRYPPRGSRAWGGSAAAFYYRPPNAAQARAETDQKMLIAATIESKIGLQNSDEIAAVEGVDIILFGATDLSLDLGIAGKTDSEEVLSAFAKVSSACRKHNKILGFGGALPPVAARFFEYDAKFVLTGMDHALLVTAAEQRLSVFKELVRPNAVTDATRNSRQ
jgi:2-keto-3-deoxy-L-rhamnonate aldolase RhmA